MPGRLRPAARGAKGQRALLLHERRGHGHLPGQAAQGGRQDRGGIPGQGPGEDGYARAVYSLELQFQGETETGARRSDDKNPYTKAGEGAMTTRIPSPLATPLTVPVADGVNAKGAPSNGRSGHDNAGGSRPL